jgi:hypothetical protein
MYDQQCDLLSLAMLFGLAIGLVGYLIYGSGLSIALGLSLGYLAGIIMDRYWGGEAGSVEEWSAV